MCDYLYCGYLRALAPARNVRVSALRVSPQGLWDKGQQVADPSASSSIGKILVKLFLKSLLGKSIRSPFQTLSGLGKGWDLMYVHCGHFKETTTLHAHTHTEKERQTQGEN